MGTVMVFLSKIRTLFQILKRAREASPLPLSCTPVSVTEYSSICLNMLKHPWKSLKKLFWLGQGSEYAWSFDMFDRLLKMPQVVNKPGFWIWRRCICNGCAEFRICLILAPYASIMPEYALMFLNMLEHDWILLNVPGYAGKCPNKLFLLYQGSQYART